VNDPETGADTRQMPNPATPACTIDIAASVQSSNRSNPQQTFASAIH
jgi:hypothetical protein